MNDGQASPGTKQMDMPLRRNREFRLLWMGGVASGLGSEFTQIAFPLLLLVITGSAGYAGFLSSAQSAAYTLIMLPAGVLADRFNRGHLMAFCTFANAVLLAILTLLMAFDIVQIFTLFTIATLMAMMEGLFAPTHVASLKQIVAEKDLNEAYAVDQARAQAAGLLGPVIGGWLFGLGRWVPFLGSLLAFLASGILMRGIKQPMWSGGAAKEEKLGWRGTLEGFHFIFRQPFVRLITLISMGYMFTSTAFPLIYIASLHDSKISATAIGFMIAAYGVAGVAGALATPAILRAVPPNLLFILGTAILPAVMVGLAMTDQVPAVVGCACLLFFSMPPLTSIARGYLAAAAPAHLQGRVFASTMAIGAMLTPISPALFGMVFDSAGRSWAFIAMATTGVLAAIPCVAKPIRTAVRLEQMTTRNTHVLAAFPTDLSTVCRITGCFQSHRLTAVSCSTCDSFSGLRTW